MTVSNNAKIGDVVGSDNGSGYLTVMLDERKCYLHRLAWLYMTGEWPTDEIDHVDQDRSNNAWANLRAASRRENSCNLPVRSDNTTGFKGVSLDPRRGKWAAYINSGGRRYSLGYHASPEEAAAAYDHAAISKFGKFAVTNQSLRTIA